jgi:plastocyanin
VIKTTLILPVLAAAALAAGCGGSGSNSSSGSSSTSSSGYGSKPAATDTPAATKTAAAPAAAGTTVNIANFAFAPADIQAKVGEKITFVNKDSTAHTATATSGAKFDSGSLDQGASFSYVAKKAGTIKFVCSFHPNMTGTITVS